MSDVYKSRDILRNMNGSIESGRMTAIMVLLEAVKRLY